MIHYLSSTIVNTENGPKHLAFCGELLDYDNDKDKYRSYSPKWVTHIRCVVEYAKIYPQQYKEWVKTVRNLRAETAIGIDYDFNTGGFTHNGVEISDARYVELIRGIR